MAIYTQYGRYIKAKLFKEMLDTNNETYMLFGLGNPYWDDDSQQMPIASYNTSSLITESPSQFYDIHINQWVNRYRHLPVKYVNNGEATDEPPSALLANNIPPFPCTWQNYGEDGSQSDKILLTGSSTVIRQNHLQDYYIIENSGSYELYNFSSNVPESISVPTDSIGRQVFVELYLRGKAISLNNLIFSS